VEVVTDRRYRFAVPPADLWSAVARPDRFQQWWPWLRRFDGSVVAPLEVWSCAVHPPLSFPVRFAVLLDHVDAPHEATATLSGDVTGTAALTIAADGPGSEARLVARLAPGNGFLRLASRIARPIVRLGHDWVLDSAVRQFTAQVLHPGAVSRERP